ncbi:MAG: branched-chain amino acid aminotransferase [Propionibacteriaceae bacterium]|jgi:branched-chain amino acid aminotransferase|nr:branched-chain amino acid aminotransferase [Propionibacteriaceae bacterium]
MALDFPVTPNPQPASDERIAEIHSKPGFGVNFTDHMATAQWTKADGWRDGKIEPYAPFQIQPGNAVLHYAQTVFEGMKAYRWADGSIWSFRPDENARRLNRSAARLMLPAVDEADFLRAVDEVVALDARWVPDGEGEKSLYIRPFLFADENYLGVRAAQTVKFAVILSPVEPYFENGVKPVKIYVTADSARAGIGGTGYAKCGGNYAASYLATQEAYDADCDQVLFIEPSSKDRLEELGGMNIMIVENGRIVTPALTGTILDGITRKSVLQVAKDMGIETEERRITPDELYSGLESGQIQEAFSCGTAAVITPVESFRTKDAVYEVPQPAGELTLALRERLVDIQYGRAEDAHGWMHRIV